MEKSTIERNSGGMCADTLRTLIDVNCGVGNWPFRPLPVIDLIALSAHLEAEGIESALVSPIEAALLEDPYDANRRLIDGARGFPGIFPVPVINPRVRRWRSEIEEAAAEPKVRAVKVHLNYHDVSVTDGAFEEVALCVAERGLPLLVPLRMEDERFHHVMMQVPPVPIGEVCTFAEAHPDCSVVCLNAYRNEIHSVEFPPNLSSDIAFAERNLTLSDLTAHTGVERVMFGSNTPFFVTRAAIMKVAHATVCDDDRASVARENARAMFGL